MHFPTLDLSISNNNAQNQGNTYFRGSGSHFVLGLNSGNTLYLNYGNSAGQFRAYGSGLYWNDVNIGTPWGSSNDGSGSGLDADLLDGKQPPTNFSATSQSYTTIPDGGWSLPTGSSVFSKSDSVGGVGDDGYWFVTGRRDVGGGYSGIYTPHSNGTAWLGMSLTGTANPTWWKIWTSGNDGSGSGLDADLLDGQEASAFANSSHGHTWADISGETANSVNSWGGLRHQTNDGYIDFGPAIPNLSLIHI